MDGIGKSGINAFRSLIKDSKKAVIAEPEQKQIKRVASIQDVPASRLVDVEKRKEQLRIGKLVLEFSKEMPGPAPKSIEAPKRGRPRVAKKDRAKNITISLSKEKIDLLDNLEGLGKGRGSRVGKLMLYYIKHQKRQKDQAQSIKESLRIVEKHFRTFARNFKLAEKFGENEKSLESLDKSIDILKTVIGLLQFETVELKEFLTTEEFSTYQYALNYSSKRKRDQ
jgi:hypothetical protein